jgi:hypothetical protein
MTFRELSPPKPTFPTSDIDEWNLECFHYWDSCDTLNFEELSYVEKIAINSALDSALDSAIEFKEGFKQVYVEFWNNYIQNKRDYALRQLEISDELRKDLDSFLKTAES